MYMHKSLKGVNCGNPSFNLSARHEEYLPGSNNTETLANGSIYLSDIRYGSMATIICEIGWIFDDTSLRNIIVCTSKTTWSIIPPCIRIYNKYLYRNN